MKRKVFSRRAHKARFRWPTASFRWLSASVLVVGAVGCRAPPDDDRPPGWSEASHSDSADPDYDRLFDLSRVERLDITLDAEVYEEMVTDASISVALDEDPMWVEATLEHDERVWEHVGMRFKGLSSIEDSLDLGSKKFPFRLSFDQYEDSAEETKNQRFYGFKKMTFDSNVKDDSFLHEVLAGEIMRDMGVPAPRASLVRIYVDAGEGATYWGLYTMVEDPSDVAMQKSQLGGKGGNLYKPGGPGADFTAFDEASFPKTTNEADADFSDVKAAVDALLDEEKQADEFRAALEEVFDVDTFLRFLATNMAIVNGDSYGCKARNYYLYASPSAGGRLVWIPWDQNEAFVGSMTSCGDVGAGVPRDTAESILYLEEGLDWPLIGRLLAEAEYREKYEAYLEEALNGAFALEAFEERFSALHDLISPYVLGEQGEAEPFTNLTSESAFEESVTGELGLLQHTVGRHALVESALSAP